MTETTTRDEMIATLSSLGEFAHGGRESESIRCHVCGQTPAEKGLEVKYKKDGSPRLPYRWIKTAEGIVCREDREDGPSINYVYECATPDPLDRAITQLRLAGRYRNALCAIELERRAQVDAYLAESFPDLGKVEQEIESLETEREAIRTRIKARRGKSVREGKSPKRLPPTPQEKERLDAIAPRLRSLYASRKARRAEVFGSAKTKARLAQVDDLANEQIKRTRAQFRADGLTWGTGGAVEMAAAKFRTGAPPRFVPSSEWSQIASQIQGGVTPNIEADPTESSPRHSWRCEIEDSRFSIRRTDRRTKGAWHYECRLRVSSAEADEHVTVTFAMHRPIPEGSRIKWVYLDRRKVGAKYCWQLRFTVQLAGSTCTHNPDGPTLWLELSWKYTPDGLRVARWRAGEERGELILPHRWLDHWQTVDDLRSIMDDLLNGYRDTLSAWIHGDPPPVFLTERHGWLLRQIDAGKQSPQYEAEFAAVRRLLDSWQAGEKVLPESLADSAKYLSRWRSSTRLAAFVLRWRDSRFEGDDAIVEAMEQWRRRDKHLCEWQGNLRRKSAVRRNQLYRVFAKEMSAKCSLVMAKKIDLKRIEAEPEPEEVEVHPRRQRSNWQKRCAAPSILLRFLGEKMPVESAPPKDFDAASGLVEAKTP